jgi:hypothetical protein
MWIDSGKYSEKNKIKRRNKMEWIQFGLMLVTLAGLFLWNRSEANSDRRDMVNVLKGIQDEMKDFHGRLCTLEEKYQQLKK